VRRHDATPDQALPPALLAAEAWARGVVEPLTRRIAEQQHQLLSQAETIGTLRAELAALRSAGRVRWYRRWRSWLAAGLVVAVVGSASCQAVSPIASGPTLCAAARQHIAYYDSRAKSGQAARPTGVWLAEATGESVWQDVTTIVAFLKTYC
jgi:hypothetical protein